MDIAARAVDKAHVGKAASAAVDVEQKAELDLIAAARNGDTDAFAQLVKANQNRIYSSVLRSVRDEHLAADITQEAFIHAWRAIDKYEDRARFGTWLYRIAMNLMTSHFRHERAAKRGGEQAKASLNAEGMAEPGAQQRTPDDLVTAADVGTQVRAAIDELEDEYKQVILMRDLQDMSYEDISELLEIPPGTVRSRLHRGRERLKEKLRHLI